MARNTRSDRLVEKAEAAMVAAVEIYNKPLFPYRAETFAILALNAWELLAKAQLVSASANSSRCLLTLERIPRNDGTPGLKMRYKRNRAGNHYTKSLWEVVGQLDQTPHHLHQAVKANLEVLTEIRDNSVHFITPGPQLAAQVQAIAVATVGNFVTLARESFGRDLSHYSLAPMHIAFLTPPKETDGYGMTQDERRLTDFITEVCESNAGDEQFQVRVNLDFTVNKVPAKTPGAFSLGRAPEGASAARLNVSEDEMRSIFKWSNSDLVAKLRNRYDDFKMNQTFYSLRHQIETETGFVWARPRDPSKPDRGNQLFFNPEILAEFDKHYHRRVADAT